MSNGVAKYELFTTYQNMYIKNINQLIPGTSKTPNNCTPSEKKTGYFEKNQVLVKNPYFVVCVFCWIFTNLSKSGGPVSNFSSLHDDYMYQFHTDNFWNLSDRTRDQSWSKRYHTRCARSPPAAVTSYAANFPFNGTGSSQKIAMDICMAFQKAAFQIWTQ